MSVITLLFFASGGSAAAQTTQEYWITPVGTDGTGSGTAASPWVCSTASSFDAKIGLTTDIGVTGIDTPVVSPIPTNSTIHLMAGTFLTHGYINPLAHWKIRGAGMDVTFIQQQPWTHAYTNFLNKGWILPVFGSANPMEDGVEISDLTIDCNVENLQTNTATPGISALSIAGADLRISKLKAINWGSAQGDEVFIFGFGGDPNRIVTNQVMEDCIVGPPATNITFINGADGFAIFGGGDHYVDKGWIANAEIRNCVVSGISTGSSGVGMPQYFSAITSVNVSGLKVTGNRIMNVAGNAFYSSCGSAQDWVIENNLFLAVGGGVSIVGADACGTNNGYARNNIQVINNYITVKGYGGGIGMGSYTDGSPNNRATNFIVTGNTILPADSSSTDLGVGFSGVDQVTFNNNVVNGTGGDGGLGLYSTSTTFASIDDNRSTTGKDIYPYGNQSVTFTPSSGTGWYRLFYPVCESDSGEVTITRVEYSGASPTMDLEFNYFVYGYSTDSSAVGGINVERYYSRWTPAGIDSIRVGNLGYDGTDGCHCYVDVHVNNAAGNAFTVKIQGGSKPLYNLGSQYPMYMGTTNMPPASRILTLGPTFQTLDPLVSGSNNVPLTDLGGKVLSSSLNTVAPAQGGLGVNASGWAAGLFPYTTSTGTFGSTAISTYGIGFIGSASASAALTDLGLPVNSAAMVTNGSAQAVTLNNNLTVNGNATVSGNVGIGTTSPSQKLSVSGNESLTGSLSIGGATQNLAVSALSANGTVAEFLSSNPQTSTIRFGNSDYSHILYFGVLKGSSDSFQFFNGYGDTNAPMMVINSNASGANGNVGIGTNLPSQRLTVAGGVLVTGTNSAAYLAGDMSQGSNYNAGTLTGTEPLAVLNPAVITNLTCFISPSDGYIELFGGSITPGVFSTLAHAGFSAWLCGSNASGTIHKNLPLPTPYWAGKLNYVTSWKVRTTIPGTYSFNLGTYGILTNDLSTGNAQTVAFTAPSNTNTFTLSATNTISTTNINCLQTLIYTGNQVQPGDYSILSGSVTAQ